MVVEKGRQLLTPTLKAELVEAAVQAIMKRSAPHLVADWSTWQEVGCQIVRNAPEDRGDVDAHDFLGNLHRLVYEARTGYDDEGAWALSNAADAVVALKDAQWPKYGMSNSNQMNCEYRDWRFVLAIDQQSALRAYPNGSNVPFRFELTELEARDLSTEFVHLHGTSQENGIMPLLDQYIAQCEVGLN